MISIYGMDKIPISLKSTEILLFNGIILQIANLFSLKESQITPCVQMGLVFLHVSFRVA